MAGYEGLRVVVGRVRVVEMTGLGDGVPVGLMDTVGVPLGDPAVLVVLYEGVSDPDTEPEPGDWVQVDTESENWDPDLDGEADPGETVRLSVGVRESEGLALGLGDADTSDGERLDVGLRDPLSVRLGLAERESRDDEAVPDNEADRVAVRR